MEFIFISLIIIAVVLFVASFFFSDKLKGVEEQFEEFSITTMQEIYQLKKRLQLLENGNKQESTIPQNVPDKFKDKPLLIQKVTNLQQQGYSVEDISKHTQLSTEDVKSILHK